MRASWLTLFCVLCATSAAQADARLYLLPHPVDLEGRWHGESGHVHEDLASGLDAFAELGDALVFLGDPIAFGWTGDVWTYRGAHPLPEGIAAYCGLSGEHRHPFAPEGAYRVDANGAYTFAGAMRGGVPMLRPARTTPRSPLALPEAPYYGPIGATFLIDGCVYTVLDDGFGAQRLVPIGDCLPRAHRHRPRRDTAPAPPPPRPSGDRGMGPRRRVLPPRARGGNR